MSVCSIHLHLFVPSGSDRSTGSRGPAGKSPGRVPSARCAGGGRRKCASPQRKTADKQGRKPSNQAAEKSELVAEVKEKSGAPKASWESIVSLDQRPAVALCDISRNFDAFSQDCGYALPDVLKTKVVGCFKREMRAGFRFEPGRFGRDKNRNEESVLAESQRTLVPSQGLTPDHQTPLLKHPLVAPGGSAAPSGDSWTSTDPRLEGAESLSNRNVARETSALDDGRSEHVPGSSGILSSVGENGVLGDFCGRMCTPTHSDAPGTSPEVACQNIEDTCQRARAYYRKSSSSCARTDMPWPFPNSGLTRASHAAPSDTINSPISTNNQVAHSDYPRETLLSAPEGLSSGPTRWIDHPKDESRDGISTGENGELLGNISLRSPDSTNAGFAPNSLQAETRPSPPSDGQRLHERESSADVNSPLHTGHDCDRSGTPRSPSAVLLRDPERTSSLYSISPPSLQPGEVGSVGLGGLFSPCSITEPLENHLFFPKDARMASFSSSESSLLLPQDKSDCDEEPLSGPPKLLPQYERSPPDAENSTVHSLLYKTCGESDHALPPMLSPVTSPHRPSWRGLLSWSRSSCGMEPEEGDTCGLEPPQIVNDSRGLSGVAQGPGGVLSPAPLTEPRFPLSYQNGAERSSPSSGASDKGDPTRAYVCADALDEVTAYKQDILLVDVTQDDAELFEDLPQTSLLKLGPVRLSEEHKSNPLRPAKKQQPASDGPPVELGHR